MANLNRNSKSVRIAYLSGPIDASETYRDWSEDRSDRFFGTIYLKQYYEICAELDAEGYVITILPGKFSTNRVGRFLIENRPLPDTLKGLLYHFEIFVWFARLMVGLFRFKPDILIVTALPNYWFLLFLLRWMGTAIVPALHCALWPKFVRVKWSHRVLVQLNRILIFRHIKTAIVVSDDAAAQLRSLVKNLPIDILVFNATYPRSQFSSIEPPKFESSQTFQVYFAGRIEINKGIYDLLEVAHRLEQTRKGDFHFDLCGVGDELERLRAQSIRLGLKDTFICHGWCNVSQVTTLLNKSHCVIIPTTTEFEEGFPKVYAEAILTGRPVITSAVCITKTKVRPAAIEVPPNDVNAYYEAVQRLRDDHKLYEEKRQACSALQEMFYNQENSWIAKLRHALKHVMAA
jgi:glycogen(starch) synthase